MNIKHNFQRSLLLMTGFALIITLSSCIKVKDKLKVSRNGSGYWKYELVLGTQMTSMLESKGKKSSGQNIHMSGGKNIMFDEDMLRDTVKEIKGARLIKFEKKLKNGKTYIYGKIKFSSIKNVLMSPLGEKINWEFKEKNNKLYVHSNLLKSPDDNSSTPELSLPMFKSMFMGLEIERTIELPNKVWKANSKLKKNNAARWSFKLDADTTEEEFKKLSNFYASCSLKNVKVKLPLEPAATIKKKFQMSSSTTQVSPQVFASADSKPLKKLNRKITITPSEITMTRQQKYVKDNHVSYDRSGINLSLMVSWKDTFKPAGYRGLVIEKAKDNRGNDLSKENPRQNSKLQKFKITPHKPNQSTVDLNLKVPSKTASKYNVKGYLIMSAPTSIKTCEIKDVKSFVGKQLDVLGLEKYHLKLKKFTTNNMELEATENLSNILELKLVSPDKDSEVKPWYTHNMPWGKNYKISSGFNKKIDNPTLVITYCENMNDYKVPFDFKNLKLP